MLDVGVVWKKEYVQRHGISGVGDSRCLLNDAGGGAGRSESAGFGEGRIEGGM